MTRRTIGLRREDKHRWEARAPLTPDAVRELVGGRLDVVVQPSPIRAFADEEYRAVGARIDEDLSDCDVVLAIKEIPLDLLQAGTTYVFFSHTIKGQPQNMPLLRRLMDLRCTLIDYERIVDGDGRRLVLFGRHAGLAGMIDTLHVLGRRLEWLGLDTPFLEVLPAHGYSGLDDARAAFVQLRELLRSRLLPASIQPFVVGITGYGAVATGAQEMLDLLEPTDVEPGALPGLRDAGLYKVVFEERHIVEPTSPDDTFELQDYYDHPARYRSIFERHARRLSVLINAIFWTEAYPRLLTLDWLRNWFATESSPKLKTVGDILCDIEGSVQCTVKATTPGDPAYVFDPATGRASDGVAGPGLCMMTTDCLPCELPVEASISFTEALLPFVRGVALADYGGSLETAGLQAPIAAATVVWRGELTPEYRYLESHLGQGNELNPDRSPG
jgi:alpha-aminoadipic semialdehyde synthase